MESVLVNGRLWPAKSDTEKVKNAGFESRSDPLRRKIKTLPQLTQVLPPSARYYEGSHILQKQKVIRFKCYSSKVSLY